MKKILTLIVLTAAAFLAAADPAAAKQTSSIKMNGISAPIAEHLQEVLTDLPKTHTGAMVLSKRSPELEIRTKAMAQLGFANPGNVITLEALRLDDQFFPEKNERMRKIKNCFTAEILSHELLHNGQFKAGLFNYPENFSGFAGVLCEKLLELQAKYTGECVYSEMRALPGYQEVIQKSGLFLVMQRQSKNPAREYALTLWSNKYVSFSGTRLFREQIREISDWNRSYAEQAFRNNYNRFRRGNVETPNEEIAAHLKKIIQFTGMPVTADELLKNAPVRPIPNGIACFENGKKTFELTVCEDGYYRRTFSGGMMREQKVVLK